PTPHSHGIPGTARPVSRPIAGTPEIAYPSTPTTAPPTSRACRAVRSPRVRPLPRHQRRRRDGGPGRCPAGVVVPRRPPITSTIPPAASAPSTATYASRILIPLPPVYRPQTR